MDRTASNLNWLFIVVSNCAATSAEARSSYSRDER